MATSFIHVMHTCALPRAHPSHFSATPQASQTNGKASTKKTLRWQVLGTRPLDGLHVFMQASGDAMRSCRVQQQAWCFGSTLNPGEGPSNDDSRSSEGPSAFGSSSSERNLYLKPTHQSKVRTIKSEASEGGTPCSAGPCWQCIESRTRH